MKLKLFSIYFLLSLTLIQTNFLKINASTKDELVITFVGDCTLGTYKGQQGTNLFTNYYDEFGADYFFENVKDIFEQDDITFINLEGPLTQFEQTAKKTFPIKGKPEYVNILKNSSIEVCNLANNHIYDCGQDGFLDNIKNLDENKIGYCGEGYIYNTMQNGIKVSCLGYRAFTVDSKLKGIVKQDIQQERNNGADIICVMFHYGIEREYYSNSVQEDISRYAIDCGADIVVGNHPHVIQGVECYNGKIIAYSLGNFSFGANKNPKDKDTFILQQTFEKKGSGLVTYGETNIIPCSISSEVNKNTYKPTPLDGVEKQRVFDRLKEYSKKYNSTIISLR